MGMMSVPPQPNAALPFSLPSDTPKPDEPLVYPIPEREGDFVTNPNQNPFNLNDPPSIQQNVEYDPQTNTYVITETYANGQNYRPPTYLTFEEFWKIQQQQLQSGYWLQKSQSSTPLQGKGLIPPLYKGGELFDRLFGPGGIDIRPTGSIDMELGFQTQRIDNPALLSTVRRQGPNFFFDMNINMGVVGKIGDKLKINTNYNTKAIFDFENQIKLEYIGDEDEIVQELRAGNVSFPLPVTLIPGSQNLFGIQSKLKFGRLSVNTVLSQQRSKARNITVQNGAQQQQFRISADDYDEDRHFFLAQYFKNNYEKALANLPYVNSEVSITRVDVYVSDNRGTPNDTQRDIVAFSDLGESSPYNTNTISVPGRTFPDNYTNDLYRKLVTDPQLRQLVDVAPILENPAGETRLRDVVDFKKMTVRKLDPSEFTFDPQLGFISLNARLPDNAVLAVAYEFTTIYGGRYQVGELAEERPAADTDDNPTVLFLKMLRSIRHEPKHPNWELMMKNVYALGAYQIQPQDFRLDIYYEVPGKGDIRYIPEGEGIKGIPLIALVNLDQINASNEPYANCVFDYIEAKPGFGAAPTVTSASSKPGMGTQTQIGGQGSQGNVANNALRFGTINSRTGKVIFPVLEPFGDNLQNKFDEAGVNPEIAKRYVYNYLYDSTRVIASMFPELNRYFIKGSYKSTSTSELSLGAFNVPQGSVRVTAGGQILQEGVDYEVNYNLGRLTILNDAIINSGVPVSISFEDNGTFGLQQRTYIGTRLDYQIHKDFNLGATFVRLSERPFTQKVNYGDDPIANSMVGLDANYFAPAPWLTKTLDKLPIYSTKEPSSISFNAEGAGFLPGHARGINVDQNGSVYVDDFEGSRTQYDLKFPYTAWTLASTPKNSPDAFGNNQFPEGSYVNDVAYGFNRAKLAWYQVDNVFGRTNSGVDIPYNYYTYPVLETDLFPNTQSFTGQVVMRPLDLTYFPTERGPYNYETTGQPGISAGVNPDGSLKEPKTRWGGIMRDSPFKNFERANVEFIEFWLLDPFIDNKTNNGQLYIQLGNVSEDVLKDGRQFYENALTQTVNLDETNWGVISKTRPVTFAFDNNPDVRSTQDIGFDGLVDTAEVAKFTDFLGNVQAILNPDAYEKLAADPSSDDFRHFRDEYFDSNPTNDIIDRYKDFNGPEGNSPAQAASNGFTNSGTNFPEMEDLNRDYTMNDSEEYFQYRINLRPADQMVIGQDYLAQYIDAPVRVSGLPDTTVRWYYFRIPITEFTEKVGSVNLRNIEFMRMFLTDFEQQVTCRFARFNMVRNTWRRYEPLIVEESEYLPNDLDPSSFFNLTSVSIEENSSREPIPYRIPPCINREITAGTTVANLLQNEQAAVLQVGDLQDGYARGIFRNIDMDFRQFRTLKMFVHAESLTTFGTCNPIEDGEMTAFMRIGDDFQNNYYEYEIPLQVTSNENRETYNALYPNGTDCGDSDRYWIWPEDNEMSIRLQDLVEAKIERNFTPDIRTDKPYIKKVPIVWKATGDTVWAKITVVGSPDIGKVKQIMLGVRNPKRTILNQDDDDGLPKCAEVWFNELRLSDFDETAGWAALARMDVKLADLGNITVTGSMHTPNFGTLEQGANERYRDLLLQYDASANLEMGKLLPKNAAIRIPVYAGVSKSVSTPQYDPYDTDILTKRNIQEIESRYGADSAKVARQNRQTSTSIKSINVTNMRKERTNSTRAPMPYDVENFTFTYAYTETENSDPIIESQTDKRHRGSINYTYNARPVYWTPFKNIIKSKSIYLRAIKDFNFNLIPSTVSFRNDLNRQMNILQLRPVVGETLQLPACYDKLFTWDRIYGLTYNPTRSISADFTANNTSVIDEPQMGKTPSDTLWANIKRFGRTRSYNQAANVSYNLPTDKIPFLSWTQIRTRYGSTYYWQASPIAMADTLGNIFGNGQNVQINGELNFTKIYSSLPFIKDVNTPKSNAKKPQSKTKDKDKDKDKDADAKDKNAKQKTPKPAGYVNPVAKALLRPLLMLRRASITYNERNETVVPGFNRNPRFFGMNWDDNPLPGWDFVLGNQPDLKNWLEWAADDSLLVANRYINDQVRQATNKTLNLKANLEPFTDFRIDLNMDLTHTSQHTEFYKLDQTGEQFMHLSKLNTGSYSISFFTLPTMFDKVRTSDSIAVSTTFLDFEQYREVISNRFKEQFETINGTPLGAYHDLLNDTILNNYAEGYGPYSQDVLLPAFIAAYAGRDPAKVNLNGFNLFPLPNWRVTYNGLSKLPAFKKLFSSFNLTHGYSSTLSINNYQNNLYFDDRYYSEQILLPNDQNIVDYLVQERLRIAGLSDLDTLTGNFFSYYRIPQVIISEQLSPLIGIDATWVNGLSTRFDYKKSRMLGMSFQDYQLSEQRSEEFTIGLGYRMKGLNLDFIKFRGKPLNLQNELAFNMDFSYRNNVTMNYRLDQNVGEPTNGMKTIRIAPSIDYVVSQRLRITLFYDRTRNIPATSASFPITNSRGGLRISFNLGQ
ncbi:cell surface protein SprA [Sphingobacteriales bacterium UPWRP_1]|nr:hypothetical protein B6N25_05730 [Sphingobacteriales bacterium TSM_CSS]PSJ78385.1 cell surface protein SprA [Sphingobacteriales bacterium UPWRP_1]